MGGMVTTGFDMTAALSVARALGMNEPAAAELLPAIEAGAMRKGDT